MDNETKTASEIWDIMEELGISRYNKRVHYRGLISKGNLK